MPKIKKSRIHQNKSHKSQLIKKNRSHVSLEDCYSDTGINLEFLDPSVISGWGSPSDQVLIYFMFYSSLTAILPNTIISLTSEYLSIAPKKQTKFWKTSFRHLAFQRCVVETMQNETNYDDEKNYCDHYKIEPLAIAHLQFVCESKLSRMYRIGQAYCHSSHSPLSFTQINKALEMKLLLNSL